MFSRTRTLTRVVSPLSFKVPHRTYKFPPRINEIKKEGKSGDKVQVRGWVRSHRVQKNVGFLEVNDGSSVSHLQLVGSGEDFKHILNGSCVVVEGTLVDSPGQKQSKEVQVQKIQVLGASTEQYPLQPKRHTMEFLRDVAHLRPRTNTFGIVMRVRNCAQNAINKYFQENGFIQVHTPILTSNDCEGAGEMFEVTVPKPHQKTATPTSPSPSSSSSPSPQHNFFGTPAYLTVSGQLEAEIYATSMSRVYTFGPTFRAEKSHTTRHLAEFWMVEPEIAFADLATNMEVAEDFVKSSVKYVLEHSAEDIEFLAKWVEPGLLKLLQKTVDEPFGRVTYTEAVKILEASGQKFDFPVSWGADLAREHEKFITEHFGNKPVFITDYPSTIKPFYMRENEDGKTVACMDLVVPEVGELIGGSAREERLEVLNKRMEGLSQEAYGWYTDLRRYGSVPHAGFGMGFERFIQFVTGVKNIRDVIPIPRHAGYCKF